MLSKTQPTSNDMPLRDGFPSVLRTTGREVTSNLNFYHTLTEIEIVCYTRVKTK
jgi:hypothetical protein